METQEEPEQCPYTQWGSRQGNLNAHMCAARPRVCAYARGLFVSKTSA